MPKILQTILLVLTVSLAAAARISIMGWLFMIGIGSVLILSIAQFYIHFYAMNNLATGSKVNIIKIILSHLFFLSLFFFQSDAGDDRGYMVLDIILGRETGLAGNSGSILALSFIAWVFVAAWIIVPVRKSRINGANHGLLIPSILLCFILPFLFITMLSSIAERNEEKKMEATGKYGSLNRALRNRDKVMVLAIDSYDFRYDHFPEKMLQLTGLRELDLRGHHIRSIPGDIGRLKELEMLDLTNNNIDEINPSICDCKHLKDLRIGGDSILSLPPCLAEMKSLTHLTIQSNSVNTLMDELRKFRNIRTAHFYTRGILFDREKWWKLTDELGIE